MMRHVRARLRGTVRPLSVAVVAALALTTLAAPAEASPAGSGGKWLARELTDGLMHNEQYDFADYGLTIDAGLALAAIDRDKPVRRIRRAVGDHVGSYITGRDFGAPDDRYAGAVAKSLVWAQVSGADPGSYGGYDLVRELRRLVDGKGDTKGRIRDRAPSDYANTIGQAFAVRGLWEAKARKKGKAFDFLLDQQCRRGYFRLNFSAADAADQTCDGAARADRAPDTDVTALAALSLMTLPPRKDKAHRAANRAIRWLERRQARNGSFTGGPTTDEPNANSTGLAAAALGYAGICAPAKDALQWVRKHQVRRRHLDTALAGEKGAVAYDRAAFRQGRREGITAETSDQWRRTTAQAVLGLYYARAC